MNGKKVVYVFWLIVVAIVSYVVGAWGMFSYMYDKYVTPTKKKPRDFRTSKNLQGYFRSADIVIGTKKEAKEVLKSLRNLLTDYEFVTIADFNDLVGIDSDYRDNLHGWHRLEGVSIERVVNGYIIILPDPIKL